MVEIASESLRAFNLALFCLLGLIAVRRWQRDRLPAAAWAAVAFTVIAVVGIAGRFLPPNGADSAVVESARRGLLALLILFPYALFRFAISFEGSPVGWSRFAAAVTALLFFAGLALPDQPSTGEPWPWLFTAYVLVLLIQWSVLSFYLALRLWRSGTDQPTVARRRMRTLSLASIGLSIALIFAGSARGMQGDVSTLVTQMMTAASSILFLLAFALPGPIRRLWRRPDEERLNLALTELIRATSAPDVCDRILPHVLGISAARAAAVLHADGHVVGSLGIDPKDVFTSLGNHSPVFRLDADAYSIVIWLGPYVQFFGRDETELLRTLAAFASVSLERCEVIARERDARAMLNRAQEIAHIGSWEWSAIDGSVKWSDEMFRINGWSPGAFEPNLHVFMEVVHPGDRSRVADAMTRAARVREGFSMGFRIVRPDGNDVEVSSHATVVFDDEGGFKGMVGTAQDVTEQTTQQRALQEATARAEQASGAKTEFLSRMSHELRTPLHAVLGFAQIMALDDLTQEHSEAVAHIATAGRHLLDLINEVLDLERIESGRFAVSIEPVDVSSLLDECVSMIAPLARSRGVTVTLDPSSERAIMMADLQRLKQVIINLLSNAVKYNRPGGLASVAARMDGDNGEIRVEDSGAGISRDDLDRIFEPFERLSAAESEIEGTGLGLALSKRLVETMHGSLQASSRMGHGSTFTIVLPLAVGEPREPSDVPSPAGPRHRVAGVVLYIEDNAANLRLIEFALSRLSEIRLLTATRADRGRMVAFAERPDLILLDLQLPDASGADVLAELRADPRTSRTPIVVVSADATRSQVDRMLQSGATDYLAKPFDVGKLLAIVERFCGADRPRVDRRSV